MGRNRRRKIELKRRGELSLEQMTSEQRREAGYEFIGSCDAGSYGEARSILGTEHIVNLPGRFIYMGYRHPDDELA